MTPTTSKKIDSAPPGAVLVGCCVSAGFIPALEMVAEAMQARHPKASADQLLDMIFLRGLKGVVDDLGLPRIDSNPDEDS
jgi:hypothetical protein